MHRITALALSLGTLLGACQKGEKPVEPRQTGEVETRQVAMGPEYRTQIWYDLSDNEVVRTNPKLNWDLAFHCADSSRKVFLNTSTAMKAAYTGRKNWDAVANADTYTFKPDHPAGWADSLAIDPQWDRGDIYVIDRGTGPGGKDLGMVKLQLKALKDQTFRFKYSLMNRSRIHEGTVTKDQQYNTVAFSFDDHETKRIEPPKDAYDLVFTQYTHIFYNPYRPYLVTGVLLNRHQTRAAMDTSRAFAAIERSDARQLTLSKRRDLIGFDWKTYNFSSGAYTMNPGQVYIVRDAKGFYYKLQFRDFYDADGQKGYPLFAAKRL